jgi:ethanolamine utilization protein EutN
MVTATSKSAALEGRKILVVSPVDPAGKKTGRSVCAVDVAQAGIGDTVLVLDEGNSARTIIGDPMAPVRTVVVGIVDSVDMAVQEEC